jgi:hypothetical protein
MAAIPSPPPVVVPLKIVLLLDESGSMREIAPQIRASVNDFIRQQQELQRDDGTTFTLVAFSDIVQTKMHDIPIQQVKPIDHYEPSGSTALFDAIGQTIQRFRGGAVRGTGEEGKEKKCNGAGAGAGAGPEQDMLVVIVTDGEENASRVYRSFSDISRMIANCKEQPRPWRFIYLCTDVDSWRQGVALGATTNLSMRPGEMATFLGRQLSNAVSDYRSSGKCPTESLTQQPGA